MVVGGPATHVDTGGILLVAGGADLMVVAGLPDEAAAEGGPDFKSGSAGGFLADGFGAATVEGVGFVATDDGGLWGLVRGLDAAGFVAVLATFALSPTPDFGGADFPLTAFLAGPGSRITNGALSGLSKSSFGLSGSPETPISKKN